MEKAFQTEFLVDGFMQAPIGIAFFSAPDLIITAANPLYSRIMDRREEELLGRPLASALPAKKRKDVEPRLQQVLATGKPCVQSEVETELRLHGKIDNAYFNLVYQPITDAAGNIGAIMVVATDVTALVKEKERTRESEEKFRLIVRQSPVSMAILRGSEWVIELANESMLKHIWHRKLHQVMGRKLMDVFPEFNGQPFPELLQKVFDTGEKCSDKEVAVYIEGAPCNYLDFEYSPLFEADNSVSGIMVTAYDVSASVKERREAQENETHLRMVIEGCGLGTWELNVPTGAFAYSDKYLAAFGVSDTLSNEQLLDFMHPDDRPAREQALQEAFVTGWLYYVTRLQWKDNTMHWMEVQGKVLYDGQRQPTRVIGTSRDITDQRIYQQNMRESEEKFRLLADSMPQFIWTGDVNGDLNYFNQSVYDYTGLTFEEMEGQRWIQIIHPDDRVANVKKWREAIKNGGNFLFEHRFRRADGVYRWQLSRAIPQYDSHGSIQMWVGSSTDIHDQKTFAKELEEKVLERTKELKETNEVLEKANRELEQFAYIASHDLQEPLRKIQTFSDMLKRNINDQVAVRKYFSKIDSSAQRMGDLIKSVLDYSRLPAHPGQLMLSDLNEIFGNVKTDLELLILEKGAIVESDTLPAVPGMPLQLHQLFSNLIGNSLKFCREQPLIRIAARPLFGEELTATFKADSDKRYLELTFSDNGIGFDNKYKDQIFTIFQRLHGLQQYSGTGIGLALCKKIVENHHGHITAESELGKGSRFTVYLPS